MPGAVRKKFGILKILGIVVLLLVIAILALPFVLDINKFRPALESKLSDALGREVKMGNLKLSILRGSLGVDDIIVADNPAFSRSPFLSAKSLKVRVKLKPLIISKEIRITGIYLDRPAITLVRSSSGKWNISDLGSETETRENKAPESSEGLSEKAFIEELKITGGRVTIIEGSRKSSIYEDVSIAVNNLSSSTSFPFTIAATLPGGGQFNLHGNAGPLSKDDLLTSPMAAALAVNHFDLVASGFATPDSGLSGLVDFSGTAISDGKQAKSKGYANAERLQIVRGGSPAGKPIWMEYLLNYDLSQRKGTLSNAKVQSGNATAHLNGTYSIVGEKLNLRMKLHGTNMPVSDLTALLPAFGVTLPKGASLQGGLMNADLAAEGPVEKLAISGKAEVSKTRLVGFDLSGKMAALATLAGIQSNQQTEIEKFESSMNLTPTGIQVSNLLLIMPALGELSGNGNIAPDQTLDFVMLAKLKPADGAGSILSRMTKGSGIPLPFFVRGTASDPAFLPDTKNAARSLLGSALTGKESDEGHSKGGAIGDALRGLIKKK
ncbi:MAG: AsmA family protein [Acidobacteria bacterium]|nr:AsmA family protein [Acidobacteriota bacterium]